ncbi:hypothetical protein FOL46_001788 [Perkinsus olseni]|uniref:Peptidase C1A papain C-terminal domain-containing protein n=1 Tax=Perkinsus olseni TaxID=32597 RepID=A0A7J6MBB7_PEROL|nr:hypothetical protein FOL46_001788 [Perkinsus olseni]
MVSDGDAAAGAWSCIVSVMFERVNELRLVYTPEEEAQHFERFEEDLRSQPKSISTEAAAELYDETRPAIMKSFVDEINSMQTTWTASAEQGRFKGMAFRDIKRLCGSFLNRTENLKEKVYPPEELRNLPASFDAREGWMDAGYHSPSCSTSCRNSKYSTTFDKDRHYVEERYPHWFLKTSSVKKEIMTNGPVSAAYIVYKDFMSYKSGVYKHTKGSIVGLHAVKIIGWGEENGEEYWLVVNSWDEDWGDHGLFKIALGQCGIDYFILGSTPRV